MFGLKNIKKFITGSSDNKENGIGAKFHHKIDVISDFISKKINDAIDEYGVIREKLKDLRQTNYNLGMKHLENGNISEAVFRFKIVKKFWPHYYDAYYQLAYALILSDKIDQARNIIDQLVEKDQSYQAKASELLASQAKASELLSSINQIKTLQKQKEENIESSTK